MGANSEQPTSNTLLARLRGPDDRTAWDQFVQRYAPKIHAWCRHWQMQESDAEDITQEVLLQLVAKLRQFEYDPRRSFRAWLKTVTHHAWQDFLERRRRPGAGSGDTSILRQLETVEARDDLQKRLEDKYDRELLEEAMKRVQGRVAAHTWEAFRLLTFEGLSGAEVAPRVGMQVTMVYVAKSKVQKMLREELDAIEGSEDKP
jgi:RNA polymerase sigma factor (sigma-70 family)